MTKAQQAAADKVCDLLFEHFPHALIILEFEDEEREDRWVTEYFHSPCSTGALLGMCEVARSLIIETRDVSSIDEEEDEGGVPS